MAETPDVTEAPAADVAEPANDPIMDILTEGMDDPTKPAPSTGKDEKSQDGAKAQVADKPEDKVKADDTAAKPADEARPADNVEDRPAPADDDTAKPAEDAQPQGKAEERKLQLNTEIRDLVGQRNALKTDIEKINAEYYQPATEEQLVESGMTQTDARVEALSQRLEVRDYNDKVAEAQLTIESEAQRVLTDFPVFNKDDSQFDKALADEAADLFNDSLIRDENTGQVIGSTLSPYKLYKALASSHSSSVHAGQLKGQKATQQMLARADSTPDAAPKVAKKDPILAILEDVDGD